VAERHVRNAKRHTVDTNCTMGTNTDATLPNEFSQVGPLYFVANPAPDMPVHCDTCDQLEL